MSNATQAEMAASGGEGDDVPPTMLRGAHMDRLMPNLGRRERATLGRMLLAGLIGQAELVAANRWLTDYLLAEHGVWQGGEGRGEGASVAMFAAESRAQAATAHRMARAAVGEVLHGVLLDVVHEGRSFRDIVGKGGRGALIVRAILVNALRGLVEHYTARDAARKNVRL